MRSNNRAQIALNAVFVIMVALVSIGLLVIIFGGKFPGFAQDLYCSTVYHVQSAVFIPEPIRADETACPDKPKGFVADPIKPTTLRVTAYDDGVGSKTIYQTSPFYGHITLPDNLGGDDIKVNYYSFEFSAELGVTSFAKISIGPSHVLVHWEATPPAYTSVVRDETFAQEVQEIINACSTPPCTFTTIIQASNGDVTLENFVFEYSACYITEILVAHAIKCFEDANFGRSSADRSCTVLPISKDCKATTITTEDVSEILKANRLCSVLSTGLGPPQDKCGSVQRLEVIKENIQPGDNILIEYDAELEKIIIS